MGMRTHQFVFALLAGMGVLGIGAGAAPPVLQSAAATRYDIAGYVGRYVDAVVANWLLPAPHDNPAMLEMFAGREATPPRDLLPWSGEFAGKYLTSSVQVLRLTGDERLRRSTAEFVERLVALQTPEGYLGPYPKELQLTGKDPRGNDTWDAWGHYHAMLGLLLWHEESGDKRALDAARRIGDLLGATFPAGGKKISSTGSAEMNQAVAHSLVLLHERTGEEKYLAVARRVVDDFAAPGAGDYLRLGAQGVKFFELPKPRWESLHPVQALAALYRVDGEARYRAAFENLWWSIAEYDRHNNGGFSSGEQAQGNPYHPGAIETCCTIAWIALSVDMLRLTGDPRIADELELSTLNQVVALHSPDGKWCTYNTPMEGRRVPSTVDIAFQIRPGSEGLNCCSVNAARGLGMISDWALMKDRDGLVLNWYGPSRIVAEQGGVPVTLTQETEYPLRGTVVLRVDPERPARFPLKLRVPHWSAETRIRIGKDEVPAPAGEYATIDREWKRGDVVSIELDRSPRYWAGERECAGKVSVYHGPLLLCYEYPPEKEPTYKGVWEGHGDFRATRDANGAVSAEFEGDAVEWRGAFFDDGGRARVFIDGKEVDVVDQFGAGRGQPFVWRRAGLGPGHHLIRIECLAEKSAQSKDVWINVARLQGESELPAFDVRQLVGAEVHVEEGRSLRLATKNVAGQTVTLRDFGTAGAEGRRYSTWLPVEGVGQGTFSRDNPSRTARPKRD